MIETICRDCVFASYNTTPEWGNIVESQNGCTLGRINKFLEQNRAKLESELGSVTVSSAEESKRYLYKPNTANKHKYYYRIKGLCNTCRNEFWLKQGEHITDAEHRVMREAKLRFIVYVFVNGQSCFDDIRLTLESLYTAKLPPDFVTIIIEHKAYALSAVKSYLDPILIHRLKYDIHLLIEQDSNRWLLMDRLLDYKKHNFFSVCQAGYRYGSAEFSNIDTIVNNDLGQVYISCGQDHNGLICNSYIYSKIRREYPQADPIEKLLSIIQEQNVSSRPN